MQEIRFHGRGGQGTVVASIVLAKAFFAAGYDVQTFPVFGVERRGAPVEAYLRLDHKKILVRANVYRPDHIIVQDPQLLAHVDVIRGLKAGGWVLLNAPGKPELPERFKAYRLAWVDATRIALDNALGTRTQPIVNTAMLGAFARVMTVPTIEQIGAAIASDIAIKTANNVKAAYDAFGEVQMDGPIEAVPRA
jgi:pyruvate ferredoxin oxidoreductase gamma subunit/2-oxoisovalerate ferredoxin oxidoreductase gamma subunit